MSETKLSPEDLTKFGIVPEDEGPHAFDPEIEWWNESWYMDWFDASGSVAGHIRIGIHPNQGRAWVWFYLHRDGECIVLEEPRLPLSCLKLDRLSYEGWGFRFSYSVKDPLRTGRLQFDGFGRVISGPRAGSIMPVGADLEITAIGPPHSLGASKTPGHGSEKYPASRLEQPTTSRGTLRIDEERFDFEGRGERDHSWGPRLWNFEWTWLMLNGEDIRLLCVEAVIQKVARFAVGYLHRDTMISITEVDFDLSFDTNAVLNPVSGRFSAKAEDGSSVSGEIETITSAEPDITHTFVPPERSFYRRSLVRVRRDDGGEPLLGWMEFNRLPDNE